MVAAGVAIIAVGAGVVILIARFGAIVAGPRVTGHVTLLAIGVGASGSFPTLCNAKCNCQAISNFALFEFDHPKGTLGTVALVAKGIVVTFILRIM